MISRFYDLTCSVSVTSQRGWWGPICSMRGGDYKSYRISIGKPELNVQLRSPNVLEKNILKWMSRNWFWGLGVGSKASWFCPLKSYVNMSMKDWDFLKFFHISTQNIIILFLSYLQFVFLPHCQMLCFSSCTSGLC